MKPDNLILDAQGHVYITDFNCSVSLKERTPDSQAGTLEYMGTRFSIDSLAPDMFMQKPYKFSVDWWSFGVVRFSCINFQILYQCTYGSTPFKEHTSEKTVEAILNRKITLPLKSYAAEANPLRDSFILGLLERDISKRLGSSDDGLGFPVDIMKHPWLQKIDWKLLEQKKMCPTSLPAVNLYIYSYF